MTYKVLGVFIVALGVLGIALPVLPTTPFLLLALWFFGRSSERLREWVLDNRIFGSYIRAYRSGRGLPVRMKVWTLVLLWTAIGISVWRVDPVWLKCLLGVVAVAVTIHILCLGRRRTVVLVPTLGEAAHIAGATISTSGRWTNRETSPPRLLASRKTRRATRIITTAPMDSASSSMTPARMIKY